MVKIELVRLFDSKDKFMRYVNLHNDKYRDDTDSKRFYLSLIDKYRQAQDYKDLFKDDSYIRLVYKTLDSWDLNKRGARLADFHSFEHSIQRNVEQLSILSKYRLECLKQEDLDPLFSKLWSLFSNLVIMDTHSKIVGLSKTLHFLLPHLVMPIDRRYILSLLYLGGRYSKEAKREFNDFKDIFRAYIRLAQHINLSADDVDSIGWNTSIPKMIDNAIIGFIAAEIDDKVKNSSSNS